MDALIASVCAFASSLFVVVFLVPFVLWLVALIDILRNEFTGSNKLIWLLAVTFFPLIGPILYYFIGTRQKITPTGT
jgi:hypothetical protein